MALTAPKIKQAKPKEKDYKLSDSKGLFLLVTKSGGKYWRLKYRFLGVEKLLSLGGYPKATLKQARKACNLAKDQIEQGIDPSQAKKAKKVEQAAAQTNNFESIAREWHHQQSQKWSASYSAKVLRAIERDLFPYIGTLPLDTITPPQLLAVFRRVESRGALESAHRLKQSVGQVFRYAVATGRAQRDITPDLKGALATPKKNHFPAITEPDKVGRLLNMLDAYQGTSTVRAALKLAPLIFVRPKELRCAEWSEIDLELAEWRIPAEKMKMGVDHIVPLSRQAVEVLQEQKILTGHWKYVFPTAKSPRRPMSDNAVLSAFRNMGISKDEMTGHGFRAMARTILDEILGERVELKRKCLSFSCCWFHEMLSGKLANNYEVEYLIIILLCDEKIMKSGKQRRLEIKEKRRKRAEKLNIDTSIETKPLPAGSVEADHDALIHNNTYRPLPLFYIDKIFTCRGCGSNELWTAKQQKWWYEVANGHIDSTAINCRKCRDKTKAEKDRQREHMEEMANKKPHPNEAFFKNT